MAEKTIKKLGGKIDFKVDTDRRIVHETNSGLWRKEEIVEFQNTHEKEVEPMLNIGGSIKPWAKISDLREYRMSKIVDEVNAHSTWAASRGVSHVAIVIPTNKSIESIIPTNKLIEFQMTRSVGGSFKIKYFYNIVEADKWLKSVGF